MSQHKRPRIPTCLGRKYSTIDGDDFDCDYPEVILCEDCICNFYNTGGTYSPITGKQSKVALRSVELELKDPRDKVKKVPISFSLFKE